MHQVNVEGFAHEWLYSFVVQKNEARGLKVIEGTSMVQTKYAEVVHEEKQEMV
jgi:hypothetical protein